MIKMAALVVLAALTGYGMHALAQARIDVRPAVTPMGTSSSSSTSFAWFYDPASRVVYVCRAGQNAADAVQCKASASLP